MKRAISKSGITKRTDADEMLPEYDFQSRLAQQVRIAIRRG